MQNENRMIEKNIHRIEDNLYVYDYDGIIDEESFSKLGI